MDESFFDDMLDGRLREDIVRGRLEEMYQRRERVRERVGESAGENVEEIVFAARAMMRRMKQISPDVGGRPLLDIVGTGGDGKSSLNISTIAAFVAAGAGCKVAKHCNKGVSSKFGSVDLLEELGINVNLLPEETKELIEKYGIGFMYAQSYHPAMQNVAKVRGEIGHRTIFNLLGPLTNPANAQTRLIGAYSVNAARDIAYAARTLGIQRVLVAHAHIEGIDEISAANPTMIFQTETPGSFTEYSFVPRNPMRGDLKVSSAEESAQICRRILYNKTLSEREEAMRESVLLNAGMGIYVNLFDRSKGDCLEMARYSIESGNAARKLEQLVEATNQKR